MSSIDVSRSLSTCSTATGSMSSTALNGVTPAGHCYYGKSHFMADLEDAAIETLLAQFDQVSSPLSVVVFQQLGNAANRVPVEATAFGHRGVGAETWFIGCSGEEPIGRRRARRTSVHEPASTQHARTSRPGQ